MPRKKLPEAAPVKRIGVHTSISGSLEKAALKAAELGANTFQIFSASPRMWKASTPAPEQIRLMRNAREKHDLYPLVIHDSYLINLASCDEALRQQSTGAFRGELERAAAIGAEYLVAHPGNCKGHSVEEGIVAVVRSLAEASRDLDLGPRLTILLENMAGAGATLGSKVDELQSIRDHAMHFCDLRIGFCVDTCHAFASGHDTVKFALALGVENVHVIHTNDSKGIFASHLDRHANIGYGEIGENEFRRVLTHPQLANKAFLLETPCEEDGDHARDIETLKRLSR